MSEIHIAPNRPVYVALVDPKGVYDFELEAGHYQTTAGQSLTLPRQAVIKLNELEPKPAEELQILMQWSGRQNDPRRWVIALSTRSEKNRAALESAEEPTAAETGPEAPRAILATPTPIRPARESDPSLFDQVEPFYTKESGWTGSGIAEQERRKAEMAAPGRGTGTFGPAPAQLMIPRRGHRETPGQIPANVAVREILAFINADANTLNWSADAKQDLASTVIIAAYKAGHIGLWEREK
jgi:hypothetical protein